MLVTVAFSELVRIRQILVTAATADERIDNVKVWANRVDSPSLDEAEDGSMKPDQEFRLLDGERACVEYPVRVARFSSVSTITLYLVSAVPAYWSAHLTRPPHSQHSFRPSPQRVFYLGFMGEAITYRKEVGESISIGAQNTADSVVHGMKEKYGSASSTIR